MTHNTCVLDQGMQCTLRECGSKEAFENNNNNDNNNDNEDLTILRELDLFELCTRDVITLFLFRYFCFGYFLGEHTEYAFVAYSTNHPVLVMMVVVVAFLLACEEFLRMFDNPFPICNFFF